MNPADLSAVEAARRIAAGTLSSFELVSACLARIESREPAVKAWAHLDPEAALREARSRDACTGPRGPLHGVPVAVKDVLDTCDMPAAYGSPIYAGHRPAWDAACVALARQAGAVVLGKTATAEFANSHPGPTCNPHDLAHTPGGSSSGSVAAVADRMVPLAFGTQTAGSIVRPAAFCGVVGYKPSFGMLPRAGLKLVSESLDTIGVFGRSVDDAGYFMQALQLPPGQPGIAPVGAPRIGIYWPGHAQAEAAAADVLASAGQQLAGAGAALATCNRADLLDDAALDAAQARIMSFESARTMAYEWFNHRAALSAELQARLQEGSEVDPRVYHEALHIAAAGRQAFSDLMLRFDVLVTLSAPGEAPRGIHSTGDSVFNRIWTLLGGPTVHLPVGTGPQGLPLGIQVVGAVGRDRETLAYARWIADRLAPSAA